MAVTTRIAGIGSFNALMKVAALGLVTALVPIAAQGDIVWDGTFDDKQFLPWYRSPDNPQEVKFFYIPEYGRPPDLGVQTSKHIGNGELFSLERSPTRGSNYSMKFTIKSRAGGGREPADCDPAVDCGRRRSQLQQNNEFLKDWKAMPQGEERWLSYSVYLPEDFDSSGSGFGPVIHGSKSSTKSRPGWIGIQVNPDGWRLIHRTYSREAHQKNEPNNWWYAMEYGPGVPSKSKYPSLLADFPDVEASRKALANLNKGGWTDFLWHFKTDLDPYEQNTGFLDVYMRADSGNWVHVLKIRPMKDLALDPSWVRSKPERVHDRVIGQYGDGGYTSSIGLYVDKDRVWDHRSNMVIYIDNYKVGDANATFADMSPDGSSFGSGAQSPTPAATPPAPPTILSD